MHKRKTLERAYDFFKENSSLFSKKHFTNYVLKKGTSAAYKNRKDKINPVSRLKGNIL